MAGHTRLELRKRATVTSPGWRGRMSVTIGRIITHGGESLLVSAKRDLCLVIARTLGW